MTGEYPTVLYRPETNYYGLDSFTFKVNDGLTDSAPATVSIAISPVNDPPVSQSQLVSADEDTVLALTLAASDVDNDPLIFTVDNPPSHGVLSGTAPNLSYFPSTNYFGPDSFTFHVNDGHVDSVQATVSISVNPLNDPPVADPTATLSLILSPNGTDATVVLDATRSFDVDDDLLEYRWFVGDATNILASGAVAIVVLPVGTNNITLAVSDGKDTTTNVALVVEVITSSQAVARIVDVVNSDVTRSQPLVASLKAAIASIDRSNPTAAVNQLRAFQNQVQGQVEPLNPEVSQTLIETAQEVIDALNDGSLPGGPRSNVRFDRLVWQSNGRVRMHFSAVSGKFQIIAASTNLVDWELIGVALDRGNGAFEFEDNSAARFAKRFYRIISP